MRNPVLQTAAASSADALRHFAAKRSLETDCWDVHAAVSGGGEAGFVLLDVRSPALYAQGHLPGAINLPHAKIVPGKLSAYPADTLFVVYCAGPHCNGADKAALRLATLQRPVKLMLGGITGWLDEGFALVRGAAGAEPA
ncbi:rhodanese-like domain-containing protein [Xanthomonas theicola]|uniref:Rhodanese n=1 Tax=Xanthomonas theicola TaxID=56464 RepID=A0A2S6ZMC5_9XANT|nr:rhodanese-like domain-containing protein [Xanthomonas theicola]PPT93385.1 rhodanese [Xanthomonas theicola]QNH25572.1 rhodanese-like domain-containing protein [Xanthomonas theicola]